MYSYLYVRTYLRTCVRTYVQTDSTVSQVSTKTNARATTDGILFRRIIAIIIASIDVMLCTGTVSYVSETSHWRDARDLIILLLIFSLISWCLHRQTITNCIIEIPSISTFACLLF